MTQRAIKKLHTMGEEKQVSLSQDSNKSNGLFPVSKYMALPDGVKHEVGAPGSGDTSFHLATLPRHRYRHQSQTGLQPVKAIHSLENGVVDGAHKSVNDLHPNPRAAVYITPSPRDNTEADSLHRPGRHRHRVNTPASIAGARVGASSTRLSVPTEAWSEGGSLGRLYQKRAQSTPPQVFQRTDKSVNGVVPGQHSPVQSHTVIHNSVHGRLSPHTVYDSTQTNITSRGAVVWPVRSSGIERIPAAGETGREVASAALIPATHYNSLPVRTKLNSGSGHSHSHIRNTKDTGTFVTSETNSDIIMMGNYYDPQELYGTQNRTSNLLKSKAKFSSMPSLFGSRDLDKKAMKREKKRIKEEEKRLKKEEKRRRKMEKKYATVNPNMMPRNWNYVQKPIEDVYMRPKLRLRAVPIDFEDGPSSRPPTVPPPPPPNIGLRRKYLHSSAPDLLRLEQVYGSLSREKKIYATAKPVYQQSEYAPRRVVLHKGPEGFGFVLRGARSQTQSGTLDFQPTPEFPALQYLDSVDQGSQADRVGLKAADFLLEINGENVVRASHERVVQLIRTARSTLAMTVVTVRPLDRNSDWFVHQDGVMTLPNRKRQAPAPPRRDPQTSLSYSKATSKSMAEGLAEIEKLDQTLAEYDGNQYARRSSMPNDGGSEPKTASVRAAHSAKRMSVVDLDTILVSEKTEHGKTKNKDYVSPSELRIMKYHKKQNGTVSNMERSKSTPDLAGEMVLTKPEAIYARSGVAVGSGAVGQERPGPGATWSKSHVSPVAVKTPEPSSLRGPIYMTPSVKRPVTYIDPKVLQAAVSSGSASKLHLSQDEPPYSVPQIPSRQPTPKRPAPPPPPVRAEVVSISTTYANVSEDIQKKKNRDSPYESSFRPGTLARLTKHPQVTTASLEQAKLKAHQRSASAGNIAVPPDAENETDKPGVSFAEDKVYESAASFMEKHPNATLLVTADVHKGQKKEKNIYEAEPEPDYDVESDEEKAESVSSSSSTKVHGTFSRQSSASSHKSTGSRNAGENKTVISVGGEGSQKNSPQNKRYTIHSDIPSSTAPFSNDPSSGTTKLVIPPRPQQPAPLPPSVPSSTSSSRRSSVQSNMSGDRDTSSDRINIMPPPPPPITSIMVQSSQPVTTITSHTTPPPQTAPPPPPPPPPVVATPPPPPPPPPPPASNPPPLPSSTPPQLRPTAPKPVPQGPPLVPTDDIMAAVAKRQARMQSDGPLMAPDRPAPAAAAPKSKLELNHEALKAAVAKRKNLLAKVDDSAVVDTIESRLQKTKKLQSAKYFFSSDTINRKDVKAISPEIAEEKHSVTPSKVPVGSTNTLKSKKTVAAPPPPVMKPAAEVNAKATQQPKEVPSKSVAAKETPASVPILTKSDSESPQPSDFLALAEKRRQEWLQKKSNGTDTGTLKKNTTTQNPTSTDSNTNKIEVIPLKGSSVEKDSKVSIRDRIAKLEKANLNLNGAVKSEGNVELGGVTEDHSHTEAGLTLSRNKKEKGLQNGSNYGYVAPPTEFEDGGNKSPTNAHGVIQIDIIPPPPIFANESSTDESGHANEQFGSAFGHDDAASLVSSVSTLSTLSSEHGEAGSPPAKHAQQYDDMIPPPPPGFDDLGEQMYDEIQGDECIPPPPQFGNSEGGKPKPIRPFQTKAVESWLCTDVMDWLDSVSMSQYRSSFAKNCIDGPKLLGLGRNDYIELGVVQVGHRMNLERSIKKVAMRKTAL
ncbi:uncharacterized protein LOC124137107 isoform X4 [Haliotis rufescens]|uniref:uncharacterized protein LOC124137107 isoform X4 n=1 Tax=Haliotis rufescens TaxID=6454 RepID=UPI00201F70F7|nr:uncharacterized protein LOC124137107 isoform X4 [Haliotis rufescens]